MVPPHGKAGENDLRARPAARQRRAFLRLPPALSAAALIADYRPSLGLRSAASLLFAIAFLWPTLNQDALAPIFAAYAFVDGALTLSPGGWRLPYRRAWPLLLAGCIDIAAAVGVYVWPEMTPGLLVNTIMAWAVAIGVSFAAASLFLRKADDERLLLLCGIAALVFARALLSNLASDAVVFSTWIGVYALTFGVVLLKLTLKYYQVLWEGL